MNTKLQRGLLSAQNIINCTQFPVIPVSIVMVTDAPELVELIVSTLNSQTYQIESIHIITKGYTETERDTLRLSIVAAPTTVVEMTNDCVGDCINAAIDQINGLDKHVISIMNQEDSYFPNYLKQMVNTLLMFNADATTIIDPILCTPNRQNIGWLLPYKARSGEVLLHGLNSNTLTFYKEIHDKIRFVKSSNAKLSTFLRASLMIGKKHRPAPPFNYMKVTPLPQEVTVPQDYLEPKFGGLVRNTISIEDVEV